VRFSFQYIPDQQLGKLYIHDLNIEDPTIDDVSFSTTELTLGFSDDDIVITDDEDIASSLSDEDLDQLLTRAYINFEEDFEE
jgi:hypothetical protein